MTNVNKSALDYARQNHYWLQNALPSLAAYKSWAFGHHAAVEKACKWMQENGFDRCTIDDFKRTLEE